MAIMIPQTPRDYTPASQEGAIFEALALLPDEYYVFHSFALTRVKGNTILQEETDFLIFHPTKGILCPIRAGAVVVLIGDIHETRRSLQSG